MTGVDESGDEADKCWLEAGKRGSTILFYGSLPVSFNQKLEVKYHRHYCGSLHIGTTLKLHISWLF